MRMILLVTLFVTHGAMAQTETTPPMDKPAEQEPAEDDVTPTFEMSPEEQAEFRSVAEMLRCPTCQGLSVLESDATFSTQIQARVKEQIAAGKSRQEILDYFTERYGNWILREPPRKGVNLLAWIFPIALLLLGPLAVWFFVWRQRQQVPSMGARSRDALIAEFEQLLAQERTRRGGAV